MPQSSFNLAIQRFKRFKTPDVDDASKIIHLSEQIFYLFVCDSEESLIFANSFPQTFLSLDYFCTLPKKSFFSKTNIFVDQTALSFYVIRRLHS